MSFQALIVSFAQVGQFGPIRIGMSQADVEALLGPGVPHPRVGPPAHGPLQISMFYWGDLRLTVQDGRVAGLKISFDGAEVRLPSVILPNSRSFPSLIAREEFTSWLDAAAVSYSPNPSLTFGRQSSIAMAPSGVFAVFAGVSSRQKVADSERSYLRTIYKMPENYPVVG